MIQAKVIADSMNDFGNRLTTMVITFPRFILAELNTHRMFSRNSASSRAIPFAKMLQSVKENPFIPIAFQKDHSGMQGSEYLNPEEPRAKWLKARDNAIELAIQLSEQGVTKQLCNRLLEPFMWHTVVVTATEWENFFALRCPKYQDTFGNHYRSRMDFNDACFDGKDYQTVDWLLCNKGQAEIHMMFLAEAMYDAYKRATPTLRKPGEWHIPFGDNLGDDMLMDFSDKIYRSNNPGKVPTLKDIRLCNEKLRIKISVARCARVSYTVVGNETADKSYEEDIKLHDKLKESGHWSPFEHIAKVMTLHEVQGSSYNDDDGPDGTWGWSGNLRGFSQYRKHFAYENITPWSTGKKS